MEEIGASVRAERRWNLMALLAATSGGFNGGDAMEFYNALMDSTVTEAEAEENAWLQEEEEMKLVERDREERSVEAAIHLSPKQRREELFSPEANMARIQRERAERGF